MTKYSFTFALLLLSLFTFAQSWEFETPDYKEIKLAIEDKDSNLFYESLMNRFEQSDSTFTLEEKRHLYYGYTFQEEYSPYGDSDYRDSLKVVFAKEALIENDYQQIIEYTDKMLAEKPFDLTALNYQLFASDKTEDTVLFEKRLVQLTIIMDALYSSGNGTTKEDAFYVIYTNHEYELLKSVGFKYGGKQSLIEHYDYLTVAENPTPIKGLYFDVTPCLLSLKGIFGEGEN